MSKSVAYNVSHGQYAVPAVAPRTRVRCTALHEPQQPQPPQQQSPRQQPLKVQPRQTTTDSPAKGAGRELDVARAVRLLRLTSVRSSERGAALLPSWMARMPQQAAQRRNSSGIDVGGVLGSIRGNGDAAASPIGSFDPDDVAEASQTTVQQQRRMISAGDASSSRTRAGSDGRTAPSSGGSAAAAEWALSLQVRVQEGELCCCTTFCVCLPVCLLLCSTWCCVVLYMCYMHILIAQINSDNIFNNCCCHLCTQDAGYADAEKEGERQFRRAVFSFDRWAAHRSTSRCGAVA
jgi:hypothetical protein